VNGPNPQREEQGDDRPTCFAAWELDALKAVRNPDGSDLLRDLVNDFRRGVPAASGLGAEARTVRIQGAMPVNAPPVNRSRRAEPRPLRVPDGTRAVDALCDAADAHDRARWRRDGGSF
jgi:hypothetical protein